MRKAMTLTEVMIVVVIVGILATLTIVQFGGPKEQMIEKEAIATLKLIASAEKIYRMEYNTYVSASTHAEINERLRLKLATNTSAANWNYSVVNDTAATFNATAVRVGNPGKVYYMNQSMDAPQY